MSRGCLPEDHGLESKRETVIRDTVAQLTLEDVARRRCNKLPTCRGHGPFEEAMDGALHERGASGKDADRRYNRELMPEGLGLARS